MTEVLLKTKANKELALEALSSAIERELKILKVKWKALKSKCTSSSRSTGLARKSFIKSLKVVNSATVKITSRGGQPFMPMKASRQG